MVGCLGLGRGSAKSFAPLILRTNLTSVRAAMNAHVSPPANVTLDQARRFLAKAVPWPKNADGYINIIWSEKKPGTEQPVWSGRACRTLEEAVGALTWITNKPGKREIYVCMSSQRTAQERVSRKGHKYLAPIRNQQNVIALKSLYLDIDFKGGEHGYDAPHDAVEGLTQFFKTTGLPKPTMIVKSGGGLPKERNRSLLRDEKSGHEPNRCELRCGA